MQDNNNSILPLSIIWDHKMNIKCFFSFLCVMCWIYLSYRSLLLFLLSFPLQHTVLIILRQCIYEKKKIIFGRYFEAFFYGHLNTSSFAMWILTWCSTFLWENTIKTLWFVLSCPFAAFIFYSYTGRLNICNLLRF